MAPAHNNLALVYAAAERDDLARGEFIAAGDAAAAAYNIGLVRLAEKRYDVASQAFDAASRQRPSWCGCSMNEPRKPARWRRRPPSGPVNHTSPPMNSAARLRRLAIAAALMVVASSSTPRGDDAPPLSVRITSPLGRIGAHTDLRFVAQVHSVPARTLQPIRFYVDGALYKTDEDGPPYAVEWVDENPFERRELSVEVEDESGRKASDTVVLEPFEIVEMADVASVLLEAGCVRQARPVRERSRGLELCRSGRRRSANR